MSRRWSQRLDWVCIGPGMYSAWAVRGPAGIYHIVQRGVRTWDLHYPDGHGSCRTRPDDVFPTLNAAKEAAQAYDLEPQQETLF